MSKIANYAKESYKELVEKVTWPTWKELQNSSVVVLIASAIIAIILLVMDKVSNFVLNNYYEL